MGRSDREGGRHSPGAYGRGDFPGFLSRWGHAGLRQLGSDDQAVGPGLRRRSRHSRSDRFPVMGQRRGSLRRWEDDRVGPWQRHGPGLGPGDRGGRHLRGRPYRSGRVGGALPGRVAVGHRRGWHFQGVGRGIARQSPRAGGARELHLPFLRRRRYSTGPRGGLWQRPEVLGMGGARRSGRGHPGRRVPGPGLSRGLFPRWVDLSRRRPCRNRTLGQRRRAGGAGCCDGRLDRRPRRAWRRHPRPGRLGRWIDDGFRVLGRHHTRLGPAACASPPADPDRAIRRRPGWIAEGRPGPALRHRGAGPAR